MANTDTSEQSEHTHMMRVSVLLLLLDDALYTTFLVARYTNQGVHLRRIEVKLSYQIAVQYS